MLKANSYKTKQFFLALIKLSLVVSAFYFIYCKLLNNANLSFAEFTQILKNLNSISAITVSFLLFLSFLNWAFEILKWQILVNDISEITFKKASTQTLAALTASLLTPNRIGDYGAKAMYYPMYQRKKIIFQNLVGNTTQMLTTMTFGGIGMAYFATHFEMPFNIEKLYFVVLIGIAITTMTISALKRSWLIVVKQQLCQFLNVTINLPKKTVLLSLLYSVMRYLIFSFQFYYLLTIFGVAINYIDAMLVISTMYFLTSIMPSIFIFDVVIKGGIAVYLFGLIGVSESIILAIVLLMWVLNFVLPSLIGSYHVLQFKLPKTVS